MVPLYCVRNPTNNIIQGIHLQRQRTIRRPGLTWSLAHHHGLLRLSHACHSTCRLLLNTDTQTTRTIPVSLTTTSRFTTSPSSAELLSLPPGSAPLSLALSDLRSLQRRLLPVATAALACLFVHRSLTVSLRVISCCASRDVPGNKLQLAARHTQGNGCNIPDATVHGALTDYNSALPFTYFTSLMGC
ncbi:hypothetical protein BC826DRAFT_517778 [Russula brevipes]|nr:hypothetical protein BC826DRAFT_517778 [Russula brevipes]